MSEKLYEFEVGYPNKFSKSGKQIQQEQKKISKKKHVRRYSESRHNARGFQ